MMGLLDEGKKLLAKEKKEKEAKEAADAARFRGLRDEANGRMKWFVKSKLNDIKGAVAITGEKVKLFIDEERNRVEVKAGSTVMAELSFGFREESQYDSDGCPWGTGKYYPDDGMRLLWPYQGRYGKHEGGENTRFQTLFEEDLAVFFAQCIKG